MARKAGGFSFISFKLRALGISGDRNSQRFSGFDASLPRVTLQAGRLGNTRVSQQCKWSRDAERSTAGARIEALITAFPGTFYTLRSNAKQRKIGHNHTAKRNKVAYCI
eukprot:727359-Rhodomonas_salina.2